MKGAVCLGNHVVYVLNWRGSAVLASLCLRSVALQSPFLAFLVLTLLA